MNKIFTLSVLFVVFSYMNTYAQASPNTTQVATLHHQGSTTVFYGLASFAAAYNASVNGDTLVLSSGTYTAPVNISKKLKIFGVGHYPDSVNANYQHRTVVSTHVQINNGADSLLLEGIYFDGGLGFYNYNTLTGVHIHRCRISYQGLVNGAGGGAVHSLLVEGCVIGRFYFYGKSFEAPVIRNNIFSNNVEYLNCTSQGIFENNNMLGYYGISSAHNWIIRNNIFTGALGMISCLNNEVYNNIWIIPDFSASLPSCVFLGNYFSVPASSIYMNHSGYEFSYSADYHLQNPGLYPGTNSTQVGIYGGAHPYKEKAIPSLPHVKHIEAGPFTDSDGNLPVNIIVKPQGY
ncbi:MAG: hypothetical protein AB9842_00695 [Bacteroidales bacterium]